MKPSDFEQAKYLETEMIKLKTLLDRLKTRKDIDKKIVFEGFTNGFGEEIPQFEFDINHSYGFFREDLMDIVEKTYARVQEQFEKYVKGE